MAANPFAKPAGAAAANPFGAKPAAAAPAPAAAAANPFGAKPAAAPAAGAPAAAAANPFGAKPAAAAPFGAAAAPAAAAGAANVFGAKPAGAAPFGAAPAAGAAAGAAAAPAAPQNPVTKGVKVSALPEELKTQLRAMNAMIHAYTCEMEAVKPLSLAGKLKEVAEAIRGLEYYIGDTERRVGEVKRQAEEGHRRMESLMGFSADVFSRARPAQSDVGDVTLPRPSPTLTAVTLEQLTQAGVILRALADLEDLHLPPDLRPATRAAAAADAAALSHWSHIAGEIARVQGEAADAAALMATGSTRDDDAARAHMDAARSESLGDLIALVKVPVAALVRGGGGDFPSADNDDDDAAMGMSMGMGRGGAAAGATMGGAGGAGTRGVGFGRGGDDEELERFRAAAAAYSETLSSQELVKQVLVTQTAALVAVTGGPVARVHDATQDLKRRVRDLLRRDAEAEAAVKARLAAASSSAAGAAAGRRFGGGLYGAGAVGDADADAYGVGGFRGGIMMGGYRRGAAGPGGVGGGVTTTGTGDIGREDPFDRAERLVRQKRLGGGADGDRPGGPLAKGLDGASGVGLGGATSTSGPAPDLYAVFTGAVPQERTAAAIEAAKVFAGYTGAAPLAPVVPGAVAPALAGAVAAAQAVKPAAGVFGAAPAPAAANVFGAKPAGAPAAANPFGAKPAAAAPFGAPAAGNPPVAPAAGVFGAKPAGAPAAANPFGAKPAGAAANPFGAAANPFGRKP